MDIYRMILQGVRTMDEQKNGVLERFCEILDQAWEDFLFDRCTDLPTLLEVENVEAKWLEHLKPLLGFSRDLTFTASTAELRRILIDAGRYWEAKPSELALVLGVQVVTNRRFRIRNYFDFRTMTGETVLGEELLDFDPHMIDFPAKKVSGDIGKTTAIRSYELLDYVGPRGEVAWARADEYAFLVIEEDVLFPAIEGVYPIKELYMVGSTPTMDLYKTFPTIHVGSSRWALAGYSDDYVTELRVVDDAVGALKFENLLGGSFIADDPVYGLTSGAKGFVVSVALDATGLAGVVSLRNVKGRFKDKEPVAGFGGTADLIGGLQGDTVLNRELLAFLLGGQTIKPFGERIDVVYVDFLDEFIEPNDLGRWTSTTDATVPEPGGVCEIADGGEIVKTPVTNKWGTQIALYKFSAEAAATAACLFMRSSGAAHYSVEIDYTTKLVSLLKDAGTVASTTLSYLKAGVDDVVRVEVAVGTTVTEIRVKINGELEVEYVDSSSPYTDGGVAVAATGGQVDAKLVEVKTLPVDTDRVGPDP